MADIKDFNLEKLARDRDSIATLQIVNSEINDAVMRVISGA